MTGPGRELNVGAMLGALVQEEGAYFATLLKTHGAAILPRATPEQLATFAEAARRIEFGPVPVIGNIIENQFKGTARNWPFGAALAFVLMAVTLFLTTTANVLVQRHYRKWSE